MALETTYQIHIDKLVDTPKRVKITVEGEEADVVANDIAKDFGQEPHMLVSLWRVDVETTSGPIRSWNNGKENQL